jgi:hypothetical protein
VSPAIALPLHFRTCRQQNPRADRSRKRLPEADGSRDFASKAPRAHRSVSASLREAKPKAVSALPIGKPGGHRQAHGLPARTKPRSRAAASVVDRLQAWVMLRPLAIDLPAKMGRDGCTGNGRWARVVRLTRSLPRVAGATLRRVEPHECRRTPQLARPARLRKIRSASSGTSHAKWSGDA